MKETFAMSMVARCLALKFYFCFDIRLAIMCPHASHIRHLYTLKIITAIILRVSSKRSLRPNLKIIGSAMFAAQRVGAC